MKPVLWAFIGMHKTIYKASGGRVMGRFGSMEVLLLTTTGRRSGKRRTAPLQFVEEEGGYVVVASASGSPTHPGWYHNLTAGGPAWAQIKRRRWPVQAQVASPEERARLWAQILARDPRYAKYEQKTAREIPLVILRPQAGA